MKRSITIFMIVLLGCAGTKELFSSLETATDRTYGYNKNNPILMGRYSNWRKNTDLAYKYLSKLNKDGRPLKMLLHATVDKPEDQPRKRKPIPRRFGTSLSQGGIFLDKWVMMPKGTTDTIELYFDVEIDGDLKVPYGLNFDDDQQNNIFQ